MPEGPQQPSKQNFFPTNPCGSGKSAWLHTILTDAYLVDLLAKESHQHLLCRPEPFADHLRAVQFKTRVTIDKNRQRLPHCRS